MEDRKSRYFDTLMQGCVSVGFQKNLAKSVDFRYNMRTRIVKISYGKEDVLWQESEA